MSQTAKQSAAAVVAEAELRKAVAEVKCRRCGCFQNAVIDFEQSSALKNVLGDLIEEARALFEVQRYECLGCEICWPALASNAAAEIDPAIGEASHCATAAPEVREGWPPLPGDYRVLRYQAPVAVCTLNSAELMERLAGARPAGTAIIGTLHTENLGIEHLIRNLLPNPHVRFLVVCGEDTRKAVGHLPGQSLVSLMREGLDESGRIRGAAGKRPVIKNVSREHVELFRRKIEIIDLIGASDVETIAAAIADAVSRDPGAAAELPADTPQIVAERAAEPARLVSDPAGYLVIYPDRLRKRLVLEHYANNGTLTRVFEGETPTALYGTVIEAGLISRLDHAAYLGRELARAEAALRDGGDYVQDKAPGRSDDGLAIPVIASCGCSSGCH
jgi:tetrahydromethanopterin S-methyltransferase subunit A